MIGHLEHVSSFTESPNIIPEKNDETIGETILKEALSLLCIDKLPHRHDVTRILLLLGADPNVLGEEEISPMLPAMFAMDTELLRILLDAGADPNKPSGFTNEDTFYDWAEFEYRYQIYSFNEPDSPTESDKKNPDTWLEFLDKMAIRHHKRRPDHLYLLRKYGAKTSKELKDEYEPKSRRNSHREDM